MDIIGLFLQKIETLFKQPHVYALERKRNVRGLIKALKTRKDPFDRSYSAGVLGEIGDARAVEPLLAALKDKDVYVRENAVEALGKIGDTRAVEPLLAALKDVNWKISSAAKKALGEIGDVRAVEPLLAFIKDDQTDLDPTAVIALGEIGDTRAVEPLLAALKDKSFFVRQIAAEALGKIGDIRAIQPLVTALKDKELCVRNAAAKALGLLGGEEAETAQTRYIAEENERFNSQKQKEKIQEQERLKRIGAMRNELEELTTELINIAKTDGFLSEKYHPRVRYIGKRVDKIGGFELMQEIGYEIANAFGPGSPHGRELEVAWDGIGNWHG